MAFPVLGHGRVAGCLSDRIYGIRGIAGTYHSARMCQVMHGVKARPEVGQRRTADSTHRRIGRHASLASEWSRHESRQSCSSCHEPFTPPSPIETHVRSAGSLPPKPEGAHPRWPDQDRQRYGAGSADPQHLAVSPRSLGNVHQRVEDSRARSPAAYEPQVNTTVRESSRPPSLRATSFSGRQRGPLTRKGARKFPSVPTWDDGV